MLYIYTADTHAQTESVRARARGKTRTPVSFCALLYTCGVRPSVRVKFENWKCCCHFRRHVHWTRRSRRLLLRRPPRMLLYFFSTATSNYTLTRPATTNTTICVRWRGYPPPPAHTYNNNINARAFNRNFLSIVSLPCPLLSCFSHLFTDERAVRLADYCTVYMYRYFGFLPMNRLATFSHACNNIIYR